MSDQDRDRFVRAVQSWLGVTVDGKPGPETWGAWHERTGAASGDSGLDFGTVTRVAYAMFPDVSRETILGYVPLVVEGLKVSGIYDETMYLMALATIRAETAAFEPISEWKSKYNTNPGGEPFGRYDGRQDLGNTEPGDGARYRGRGWVQLTGRHNYREVGEQIGVDLEEVPELATDPRVAGRVLAEFLARRQHKIRNALAAGDFAGARRIVNGGRHGIDRFITAYQRGRSVLSGASNDTKEA